VKSEVPPPAETEPARPLRRSRRFVRSCALQGAAVLAWGLLLSAYDHWLCAGRGGNPGHVRSLLEATALGAGAVVCVVWPLALAHELLWASAGSRRWPRVIAGSLEGAGLAWLVCFAQRYPSLSTLRLWLGAALIVCGASLCLQLAPRLPPRLTLCARVALVCAALALDQLLSVRRYPWIHLAADVAGAAAFLALIRPLLARAPVLLPRALAVLALAAVAGAPALASASMWARGSLYGRSTHARVHALVLGEILRPGAPAEPPVCAAGAAACAGFVPDPTSALSGSARGADLLLLSLDGLRWDHAHALAALWAELGPHVSFRHAWSPAPRTTYALSALFRGRPLRQVPLARRGGQDVVGDGDTLATVLARAGYRTLHASTHQYLAGQNGVAHGFEQLADARLFDVQRHIPSGPALARVLAAAGTTQAPVAAWVHAMETHAPYRAHGRKQGDSPAGLLRAAGALGGEFASFVRAFRRARGQRPLVVAVFADHGEEFGEHGDRHHASTVYAEQVRVTFALAAPSLPARAVDAPVSMAALPATLFDLLGIERPCTFTVESLLGCIADAQRCPQLAVSELMPRARGGPKITGYAGASRRLLKDDAHHVLQLFDSRRDPYERDDLAEQDAPAADAMLRAARAWDERYCVPRPE
jgi:hypothetical protein